MSRYDDLRREAKFTATTAATKPPATKNKGGRPLLGDRPMTSTERSRRRRQRLREARQ
jgi:hypothetical protein